MARRYYKMTAARRAALRKAQIASARKRRRRKAAKNTAVGAAAIVGGVGGGYYVSKGVTNFKYRRAYKRFVKYTPALGPAPTPRKRSSTRVGGGVVTVNGRQRGNRNMITRPKRGAFKAKEGGIPYFIQKQRGVHDFSQRQIYSPADRHQRYITNDKGKRKSRKKKK
ncbi:MAG TPA: hypothetical protein PK852_02740 [Mesotoga prima]|uniref:hypothetical protein n=1 Tax=Mesotoga prima TaxID=1184387 RepID=UPI002CCB31AC|nr:hypothetical protein [Mesotoga prima]HPE53013.1 hypothetical protein [Mesotoga prima]